MIKAENIGLTRRRKGIKKPFAIKGVDFTLEDGFIMAALGENGAGKSTLLSMLYGLLKPEQGMILWNGEDIFADLKAVRQDIAYVGENTEFFQLADVKENISLLSDLYENFSMERLNEYFEIFDIKESMLEHKLDELSTGQQKQIQLAFALARSPKLLLLDEPMANMDPVFRVDFMELLQRQVEKGSSVIFSTHILSDLEDIADYFLYIENGMMKEYKDRETIGIGNGYGVREWIRELQDLDKEE